MAEQRQFRLRITYSLDGRLAYLSHLEITRALERLIRRSGLPFAITNGFSPHMKMSFGGALPVGVGGTKEIFDVFLTDYVNPKRALSLLREKSIPNLYPQNCEYIDSSQAAASVAFPFSVYKVVFSDPCELEIPETIETVKKKKPKVLNVSDFLVDDPLILDDSLIFALESKPTGSLRPDVFLNNSMKADDQTHIKDFSRINQFSERSEVLDYLKNLSQVQAG